MSWQKSLFVILITVKLCFFIGITSLLANGVYTAAYPLHDVSKITLLGYYSFTSLKIWIINQMQWLFKICIYYTVINVKSTYLCII